MVSNESHYTRFIVDKIKETKEPLYIYVVKDYCGAFVAACDKELKGRYNYFHCSKTPVLTEKELSKMVNKLEKYHKL